MAIPAKLLTQNTSVNYVPDTETLEIGFNNGSVYTFANVPQAFMMRLKELPISSLRLFLVLPAAAKPETRSPRGAWSQ
ncbi:MAG: KTSC domain-containing protein [Christensenellales bacterium]